MNEQIHPQSLLGRIMALVPDPRGRRGRRCPLVGIVAMLLLGALEGEGSLRGMWLRARKYWEALVRELADLGRVMHFGAVVVILGHGQTTLPQ